MDARVMAYHGLSCLRSVKNNNIQLMQATVEYADDRHELSQRIKERALRRRF